MGTRRGGERNKTEMEAYKDHRRAVKNPRKKIDDAAPALKASDFVKTGDLHAAASRMDDIETANRILLQRINTIYRTKGTIDTTETNLIKSSNHFTRVLKNEEIENSNKMIYEVLSLAYSSYEKDKFLAEFEKIKEQMMFMSRYPEIYEKEMIEPLEKWTICPERTPSTLDCNPTRRVRCFLDFEAPNVRKLGRMIIEVYKDYVPVTGENFVRLCRGDNGRSYKNSKIFRIVPGLGVFGGDIENRKGASISSSFGPPFSNENYHLKFAGPGVISTFSIEPGRNNSQFLISFKELPTLQGVYVVFGRIVKSLRTLEMIEEFGTITGQPKKSVVVTNCGVLGPVKCPNVKQK